MMRCFFVVLLFVLTAEADSSCENICTFLYNNPDWENHTHIADTKFIQSVTAGSVTGIITVSFKTFTAVYDKMGIDFLRFVKGKVISNSLDESNQPMFFTINLYRKGIIQGKLSGMILGKTNLSFKISDSIQISDLNSDFYDIFFGQPGKTEILKYKYINTANWTRFERNNVRLRDVQTIKSDGRCTVYKYISACTDPTPRLCGEQHVPINVSLGSPLTLSCSGSGAPFLDVSWTKDGITIEIEPTTVNTITEPDHKIQSTITIDHIKLNDHLGNWTCTILNKNFGDTVTKTYEVKYTYPAKVVESPDYYQSHKTNNTTLTWVVESWPLEQVTLTCEDIHMSGNKNTTSVPPKLTFTLVLRMQDVVKCVLKDGEKVIETREITRVGYNCEAGERGVGKGCEVCGTGQTSVAGIGHCFPANSSCSEGSWGVGEDCTSCPDNKTSFSGVVKTQECFDDVSFCKARQYGYGTNCSLCPNGMTSKPHAKKLVECYCYSFDDYKIFLAVAWTLAALFFVTTAILFGMVLQKCPSGKCSSTDGSSSNEYIENTIIRPSANFTTDDTTYSNLELIRLK
ncbi:hypothetical protein ACHWQZ_G008406 [Mnemiopsis leidyi]